MRITAPASVRRLRKAIIEQRPDPSRRDDSGLTTLEWLLIVAAVAGLAALAVVLVTNVVGDTSEQISGQSARRTAAQLAGTEVMRDATLPLAQQPNSAKNYAGWRNYYQSRCERIRLTYTDVRPELSVTAQFSGAGTFTTASPFDPTGATTANVDATLLGAATGNAGVAHCRVV